MTTIVRTIGVIAGAVAAIASPRAAVVAASTAGPAAQVIRDAVAARVGSGADVTIVSISAADLDGPFREARPDPGARLGRPIRFTLLRDAGLNVLAVATVQVVGDLVVPVHPIGRAKPVTAADVARVRTEWRDVPLRALPSLAEVVNGRTLRPLAAGAPILPGSVVLRRPVEPGDRVTVLATSGAVEVSAAMIASDGGRVGDIIRVVNPDTRRYLRGRVLRTGVVEVTYER
jgi:flagella basal body P-ring formation protein FlgA